MWGSFTSPLNLILNPGVLIDQCQTKKREDQLSHTSKKERTLLLRLYETSNFNQVINCKDLHPMEPLLMEFDIYPQEWIMSFVGMIPPSNADLLIYIPRNIISYRSISSRPMNMNPLDKNKFYFFREGKAIAYLNRYTDVEIISEFQVLPYYDSRRNFLLQMSRLRTVPQFYISLTNEPKIMYGTFFDNKVIDIPGTIDVPNVPKNDIQNPRNNIPTMDELKQIKRLLHCNMGYHPVIWEYFQKLNIETIGGTVDSQRL